MAERPQPTLKLSRPPVGGNRLPAVPERKTGPRKKAVPPNPVPRKPVLPLVAETSGYARQIDCGVVSENYEMMPTPAALSDDHESPDEAYEEVLEVQVDHEYMNVPSHEQQKTRENPALASLASQPGRIKPHFGALQSIKPLQPVTHGAHPAPFGIEMRPWAPPPSSAAAIAPIVDTAKPPTQGLVATSAGAHESVFEVTQKDVDKFKVTETPYYDEEEAPDRSPRAKDYRNLIFVVFWTSVFLCMCPFVCICLCIAKCTSSKVGG